MGFLKKWLKEEFILFVWGWGCCLAIVVFAMFAVSLFPDAAIKLTGLFILFLICLHVFLWFKFKK